MEDLLTSLEFWSLIVAIVALGVSVWAHRRATRLSKESNDLQARMVALEEAREADRQAAQQQASLTARLDKRPGRQGRLRDMLVIHNSGAAPAREVRVELDGMPIDAHDSVMCRSLPIPVIGPSAESPFVVAIDSDHSPPFHIRLEWSDDSEANRSYETTLTAS